MGGSVAEIQVLGLYVLAYINHVTASIMWGHKVISPLRLWRYHLIYLRRLCSFISTKGQFNYPADVSSQCIKFWTKKSNESNRNVTVGE